jgi:hypothetical protein
MMRPNKSVKVATRATTPVASAAAPWTLAAAVAAVVARNAGKHRMFRDREHQRPLEECPIPFNSYPAAELGAEVITDELRDRPDLLGRCASATACPQAARHVSGGFRHSGAPHGGAVLGETPGCGTWAGISFETCICEGLRGALRVGPTLRYC